MGCTGDLFCGDFNFLQCAGKISNGEMHGTRKTRVVSLVVTVNAVSSARAERSPFCAAATARCDSALRLLNIARSVCIAW